jgi:hypothetical protein
MYGGAPSVILGPCIRTRDLSFDGVNARTTIGGRDKNLHRAIAIRAIRRPPPSRRGGIVVL